uniref:LisH domain-containing protein n=1 Tax=Poecilia mexicana TaxID=48701 RepID=A0A3B3YG66_9TELE
MGHWKRRLQEIRKKNFLKKIKRGLPKCARQLEPSVLRLKISINSHERMNSPEKNGKVHLKESTEDGDGLECADVLKDDQGVKEGHEEDLEATEKAIQDRAEAVASLNRRPSITHQQLSVFDFLLNFLFQHGMMGTLACFEAEWSELLQKGEVDAKHIDLIPKVYTQNQHLAGELKNACRCRLKFSNTEYTINVIINAMFRGIILLSILMPWLKVYNQNFKLKKLEENC